MENEHEESKGKIPQHPLNERIEKIEHDLADANKKIGILETTLLETRRFIARNNVEDLRLFLEDWMTKSRLPPSQLYQQAHEFLLTQSAAAQQAILHSTAPISIAEKFNGKCQEYFKLKDLHAFGE